MFLLEAVGKGYPVLSMSPVRMRVSMTIEAWSALRLTVIFAAASFATHSRERQVEGIVKAFLGRRHRWVGLARMCTRVRANGSQCGRGSVRMSRRLEARVTEGRMRCFARLHNIHAAPSVSEGVLYVLCQGSRPTSYLRGHPVLLGAMLSYKQSNPFAGQRRYVMSSVLGSD